MSNVHHPHPGTDASPRIELFEGPRATLDKLFALADDSPARVRSYCERGRVLVARDGDAIIGHLQLISEPGQPDTEVTSLAVLEQRQRAGVGRLLMNRAIDICRAEQRSALLVATAAADMSALAFYQRAGFRVLRIDQNVFTPEAGYPTIEIHGIPLRDQVWLSLDVHNRDNQSELAPLGPDTVTT